MIDLAALDRALGLILAEAAVDADPTPEGAAAFILVIDAAKEYAKRLDKALDLVTVAAETPVEEPSPELMDAIEVVYDAAIEYSEGAAIRTGCPICGAHH